MIQPLRQGVHIFLRHGVPHGAAHFLVPQAPAEVHVGPEGILEDHIVLEADPEAAAQLIPVVGPHVPSVQEDAPLAGVVEAQEQGDHGGFAAARGTDDPQAFPLFQREGDAVQGLFPTASREVLRAAAAAASQAVLPVAEAHVLEADAARSGGDQPLLRGQDPLVRLCLEHLVDAVGGGAGLAHGHEDAGEAHHPLGDHVEIGEEGQDDSRLQGASVHPPGPEEHHQGQADVPAELHEGAGDRHDGAGPDVRIRHLPVGVGETAHFVPGFGQGLHHPDAGDVLPHDPHQGVQFALDCGEQGNAPGGDRQHHQDQEGEHHHQDHGQAGIHEEGDRQSPQEHHGGPDAQGLELLHRGLDVVAVRSHAGDEGGQAEAVEPVPVQIGDLPEQGLPHVVAHPVGVVDGPGVGGDVQGAGDVGRREHQEAPEDDLPQHPLWDHVVDDVLQDIGDGELRQGADELQKHGDGDGTAVDPHGAEDESHGFPPRSGSTRRRAFRRRISVSRSSSSCSSSLSPSRMPAVKSSNTPCTRGYTASAFSVG